MRAVIFEKPRLRKAIRNEKTFDEVRRIYEIDLATDGVEVGGEVYCQEEDGEESLVLRDIPHKYSHFPGFFAELRKGRHVKSHFAEMLKAARKMRRDPDGKNWENLIRQMESYLRNGKRKEDAFSIANEYRWLLRSDYTPPRTMRLDAGTYMGRFHIHNGLEPPSITDHVAAQQKPELVLIYDKDRFRRIRFEYLYPVVHQGRRRSSLSFSFGPYKI